MDDDALGVASAWAGCRETHISAVYFAGDRVLKMKKPVRTSFLDYSTVERRAEACDAEVKLNRRLSPDVYLGVASIALYDEGRGEPMVVMQRLAEADELASRIKQCRGVTAVEIRELARRLAAFHSQCPADQSSESAGGWIAIHRAWLRECDEIGALGDEVAPIADLVELRLLGLRYLVGRKALFESRVKRGHVRDGHGDLRCDHVYLTSVGPRVIDCVEFDRGLRVSDVVSDMAFLAMDLERRGAPDLARQLMASYREFSGETYPESLLDFYVAFRALVQAKVDTLRARQSGRAPDFETVGVIALAIAHLRQAMPVVIIMGGLPGSGKTAISDAYAATTGVVHISSDEIRHGRRDPLESVSHADTRWEQGVYASEATRVVYEEMITRARTAVTNGYSVILDASWRSGDERVRARNVAFDTWATPAEVCCVVGNDVAYPRLTRSREGYSQAGVLVRQEMVATYEPWSSARIISTTGSITDSLDQLVDLVDATRAQSVSIRSASQELLAPVVQESLS